MDLPGVVGFEPISLSAAAERKALGYAAIFGSVLAVDARHVEKWRFLPDNIAQQLQNAFADGDLLGAAQIAVKHHMFEGTPIVQMIDEQRDGSLAEMEDPDNVRRHFDVPKAVVTVKPRYCL